MYFQNWRSTLQQNNVEMEDRKKQSVIIIGSGIAGLATAVRLAVAGFDVSVYEKNESYGGKINLLKDGEYQFDTGPSLFTQPQNIEELFELANEPIEEYFSYSSCAIACKYFFENGIVVNGFTDKDSFAEELHQKLNESPNVTKRYLIDAEKLYNNIGTIFLNHSLHKTKTWFNKRVFPALATLKKDYLFKTLSQYNASKFKSKEAHQILNRYATYNGSSPYKAPAMLSLIPHLEYNEGVYYPKNGMKSIADAVYQLAVKKGVEFHFDAAVDSIIENAGQVNGIVVNNQNVLADIVVSNMDVYFTYKNLLRNEIKAQTIQKHERSSSALIFYWGMNTIFPQLELHNIFFSENYAAEFDAIFQKKKSYKDPTVYINITSSQEAHHAPKGHSNWFVMVNVPANSGQDWALFGEQIREVVISKISRILGQDISKNIETEKITDPVSIETQTGSYMGALYGSSSNAKLAAFLRQPNFARKIKGLYFCGGTVHPGGGIPLCFKSADITSKLIKKKNLKRHH